MKKLTGSLKKKRKGANIQISRRAIIPAQP